MAGMRRKGNCWFCTVRHEGKRHYFAVGELTEEEATAKAARIDELVALVDRGVLQVPEGTTLGDFLAAGGRAPQTSAKDPDAVLVKDLCQRYLEVMANGTVEANTLSTKRTHLRYVLEHLGLRMRTSRLCQADLQGYVNARASSVLAYTVRQELATFRACWNWGVQSGCVRGAFPNKGLRFPKEHEKEPFRTLAEIEEIVEKERLAEGSTRWKALWDCLYLTREEVEEFLRHVESSDSAPWLFPMVATAAYTGARRSELLRMLAADVDLAGKTISVREKKRLKGRHSFRTAPLVPRLGEVLTAWLRVKPEDSHLFCQAQEVSRSKKVREGPTSVTKDEAHDHLRRCLEGSRWRHMRGFHCLRHSFISACVSSGVDQRILMQWVGHLDERTSRRYTHLWPKVQQEAILRVFG